MSNALVSDKERFCLVLEIRWRLGSAREFARGALRMEGGVMDLMAAGR